MERSTMKMHATMLSAHPAVRYLRSGSLAVIERLDELRAAGLVAFFTMDAGPNVKILCKTEDAQGIVDAISELCHSTSIAGPGGAAHIVENPA